jgi:hypothetical protein
MSSANTNSSSSDPHQYVTNPPSTFVKIQNITKKPELNGQYGLIVQYDTTKERYMVVLCTSQQQQYLALKYDNLQRCTSMYDKVMAQYQMMQYNPQIQQQIKKVQEYILQQILIPLFRILKIPVTPKLQYFYYMVALFLLGLWYIIGLTKLLVVGTIFMVVLSLIGTDLFEHKKSTRTILLQTLPNQYTKMIQTELPYNIGTIITKKPWYLRSFTTLLVLFIAYTLFGTPTRSMYFRKYNKSSRSSSSSPSSSSYLSSFWKNTNPVSTHSKSTNERMEYYYKLGFDDATQHLEYGTSFVPYNTTTQNHDDIRSTSASVMINDDGTTTENPAWKDTVDTTTTNRYDNDPRIYNDDDDDFANDRHTSPNKKASPWSFSTMMAVFTIYRILQPIVAMSMSNTNHYQIDWHLLRTNLIAQMNPWKMMIVAFSLYRIVVAFL